MKKCPKIFADTDSSGHPHKVGYYDPMLLDLLDQVKTNFKVYNYIGGGGFQPLKVR